MNQLVNSVTVLLSAIVGVAILSVILSKNSNTTAVITAGTTGFGSLLKDAEGPVSGSSLGSLPSLGSMDYGTGTGW